MDENMGCLPNGSIVQVGLPKPIEFIPIPDMYEENKPHPWGEFLKSRMNAILWMKEEMGRDDKLIAHQLSMDERQVYLIRIYAEKERNRETQAEGVEPSRP